MGKAARDVEVSTPNRIRARMNAPDSGESPAIPGDGEDASEFYPLEVVVQITRTPDHVIALYCEHGLVQTVREHPPERPLFDDEAIHQVRRLEFLRSEYGVNFAGLRFLAELLRDVEQLRAEVRFLQRP